MSAKASLRTDLPGCQVDLLFMCSCGENGTILAFTGAPVACPRCSAVWNLPVDFKAERGPGASGLPPVQFLVGFDPDTKDPELKFLRPVAGPDGQYGGMVIDPESIQVDPQPAPASTSWWPMPASPRTVPNESGQLEQQPEHPGYTLRRAFLEPNEMTSADLAKRLFVPKRFVDQVLAEKTAMTPDLAMRLERLGWSGAYSWLAAQALWDLDQEAKDPKMAKIQPISTGL